MKKHIIVFITIILIFCFILPTSAAFLPHMVFAREALVNNRLDELSYRFSNFEANWNRFQLGGSLTISTISQEKLTNPDFVQDLGLFFDVNLDSNLQFNLRMSHSGGWGFSYQSLGSTLSPLNAPLQIDEAFLRYQNQNNLHYLGRFRFSLGHLGLISDFIDTPAEGLALQHQFGQLYLSGLFVRIITPQFQTDTQEYEASQENYLSSRIAWTNETHIFGINLVPDGLTGEKSFSFDYSLAQKEWRLNTELAWYSFHLNQNFFPDLPNYSVSWTPGILITYSNNLSPDTSLQIKAGFLSPQFTPAYSSLAHASRDQREWFLPNSQGVEVTWEQLLSANFRLNNRLICMFPVEFDTKKRLNYHWLGSLSKQFSPVNQLELGAEIKEYPNYSYSKKQLFLKWNLQF